MKFAALLFVLASFTCSGFAQIKPDSRSVEEILMQMERDWSGADAKKDGATLNRIIATDWVGIDFEGNIMTKETIILSLQSPATSLQSTELGDMKVRVYGNTAIVTGTDVEKSTFKGKDSSGTYIWTDVFVLREGRWQAVASQSTKISN